MIKIDFQRTPKEMVHNRVDEFIHFDLRGKSTSDKVKLLILRDLWNVNWDVQFGRKKIVVSPPEEYDKSTIKSAMSMKRLEVLYNNKRWIKDHIEIARNNLASGEQVLTSSIKPVIEVCTSQKQMDLFRIMR